MILIKTMKKKHLYSTLKKGEFCFNVPTTFFHGQSLATAQQDKWDSHLSFDALHLVAAPILSEDENGPHYGPTIDLADRAKMHLISDVSARTPLCSFRRIGLDEYIEKYGACFFRLGNTVDRIKKEFQHDSFILIADHQVFLDRIAQVSPIYARDVHYGEINTKFRETIEECGYSLAAMFQKGEDYKWQQEYRVVLAPQEKKTRVIIEIGSIEDIAFGGDIEQLRSGFVLCQGEAHLNEINRLLASERITIEDLFTQAK